MEYTDKAKAIRYAESCLGEVNPDVVVIESRGKFYVESDGGGMIRTFERVIWRNGKAVKG